jgi:hypothetical protein
VRELIINIEKEHKNNGTNIQFNFLDGTEIKIIFGFLRILFANLEL